MENGDEIDVVIEQVGGNWNHMIVHWIWLLNNYLLFSYGSCRTFKNGGTFFLIIRSRGTPIKMNKTIGSTIYISLLSKEWHSINLESFSGWLNEACYNRMHISIYPFIKIDSLTFIT
jgi:hypothetical protein